MRVFLGIAAIVGAVCFPASADTILTVNVDTSSITGFTGFLDFDLAPGDPLSDFISVVISNFQPTGGLGGLLPLIGDASGDLNTQVFLDNAGGSDNDFAQYFTYGTTLSFQADFSGPGLANDPLAFDGTGFFFSTLNGCGCPLLFKDTFPEMSPSLFLLAFNTDGTHAPINYNDPAGTVSFDLVETPEPALWTPLTLVLGFGWIVLRRRHSRSASLPA